MSTRCRRRRRCRQWDQLSPRNSRLTREDVRGLGMAAYTGNQSITYGATELGDQEMDANLFHPNFPQPQRKRRALENASEPINMAQYHLPLPDVYRILPNIYRMIR